MELCGCCKRVHRKIPLLSPWDTLQDEQLPEDFMHGIGSSSLTWFDDLTESVIKERANKTVIDNANQACNDASTDFWSPCPRGGTVSLRNLPGPRTERPPVHELLQSSFNSSDLLLNSPEVKPRTSLERLAFNPTDISWTSAMATPVTDGLSCLNESDWREKPTPNGFTLQSPDCAVMEFEKRKVIHRKLFSPGQPLSKEDSLSQALDADDTAEGDVTIREEEEDDLSCIIAEGGLDFFRDKSLTKNSSNSCLEQSDSKNFNTTEERSFMHDKAVKEAENLSSDERNECRKKIGFMRDKRGDLANNCGSDDNKNLCKESNLPSEMKINGGGSVDSKEDTEVESESGAMEKGKNIEEQITPRRSERLQQELCEPITSCQSNVEVTTRKDHIVSILSMLFNSPVGSQEENLNQSQKHVDIDDDNVLKFSSEICVRKNFAESELQGEDPSTEAKKTDVINDTILIPEKNMNSVKEKFQEKVIEVMEEDAQGDAECLAAVMLDDGSDAGEAWGDGRIKFESGGIQKDADEDVSDIGPKKDANRVIQTKVFKGRALNQSEPESEVFMTTRNSVSKTNLNKSGSLVTHQLHSFFSPSGCSVPAASKISSILKTENTPKSVMKKKVRFGPYMSKHDKISCSDNIGYEGDLNAGSYSKRDVDLNWQSQGICDHGALSLSCSYLEKCVSDEKLNGVFKTDTEKSLVFGYENSGLESEGKDLNSFNCSSQTRTNSDISFHCGENVKEEKSDELLSSQVEDFTYSAIDYERNSFKVDSSNLTANVTLLNVKKPCSPSGEICTDDYTQESPSSPPPARSNSQTDGGKIVHSSHHEGAVVNTSPVFLSPVFLSPALISSQIEKAETSFSSQTCFSSCESINNNEDTAVDGEDENMYLAAMLAEKSDAARGDKLESVNHFEHDNIENMDSDSDMEMLDVVIQHTKQVSPRLDDKHTEDTGICSAGPLRTMNSLMDSKTEGSKAFGELGIPHQSSPLNTDIIGVNTQPELPVASCPVAIGAKEILCSVSRSSPKLGDVFKKSEQSEITESRVISAKSKNDLSLSLSNTANSREKSTLFSKPRKFLYPAKVQTTNVPSMAYERKDFDQRSSLSPAKSTFSQISSCQGKESGGNPISLSSTADLATGCSQRGSGKRETSSLELSSKPRLDSPEMSRSSEWSPFTFNQEISVSHGYTTGSVSETKDDNVAPDKAKQMSEDFDDKDVLGRSESLASEQKLLGFPTFSNLYPDTQEANKDVQRTDDDRMEDDKIDNVKMNKASLQVVAKDEETLPSMLTTNYAKQYGNLVHTGKEKEVEEEERRCQCQKNEPEASERRCRYQENERETSERCQCQENEPETSERCRCQENEPETSKRCRCQENKPVTSGRCWCQENEPETSERCRCQENKPETSGRCQCQENEPETSERCRCQENKPETSERCRCQENEPETSERCRCQENKPETSERCRCQENEPDTSERCQCQENEPETSDRCRCQENEPEDSKRRCRCQENEPEASQLSGESAKVYEDLEDLPSQIWELTEFSQMMPLLSVDEMVDNAIGEDGDKINVGIRNWQKESLQESEQRNGNADGKKLTQKADSEFRQDCNVSKKNLTNMNLDIGQEDDVKLQIESIPEFGQHENDKTIVSRECSQTLAQAFHSDNGEERAKDSVVMDPFRPDGNTHLHQATFRPDGNTHLHQATFRPDGNTHLHQATFIPDGNTHLHQATFRPDGNTHLHQATFRPDGNTHLHQAGKQCFSALSFPESNRSREMLKVTSAEKDFEGELEALISKARPPSFQATPAFTVPFKKHKSMAEVGAGNIEGQKLWVGGRSFKQSSRTSLSSSKLESFDKLFFNDDKTGNHDGFEEQKYSNIPMETDFTTLTDRAISDLTNRPSTRGHRLKSVECSSDVALKGMTSHAMRACGDFGGFNTASGKFITISDKAKEKANKIWIDTDANGPEPTSVWKYSHDHKIGDKGIRENVDSELKDQRNSDLVLKNMDDVVCEFTSAGGKKMPASHLSKAKAMEVQQSADEIVHSEEGELMNKINLSTSEYERIPNRAIMESFNIASEKLSINMTKDSMKDFQKARLKLDNRPQGFKPFKPPKLSRKPKKSDEIKVGVGAKLLCAEREDKSEMFDEKLKESNKQTRTNVELSSHPVIHDVADLKKYEKKSIDIHCQKPSEKAGISHVLTADIHSVSEEKEEQKRRTAGQFPKLPTEMANGPDLANNPSNQTLLGTPAFSSASGSGVKSSISGLDKAKVLFEEENSLIATSSSKGDENLPALSSDAQFLGFSTASGLKVKVSEKSLQKAKTFLDNACSEDGGKTVREEVEHFPRSSPSSVSHEQVPKVALRLAQSIVYEKKHERDTTKNYWKSDAFRGFSTASGSKVKVSENALRHAKTFFDDDHCEKKSKNEAFPVPEVIIPQTVEIHTSRSNDVFNVPEVIIPHTVEIHASRSNDVFNVPEVIIPHTVEIHTSRSNVDLSENLFNSKHAPTTFEDKVHGRDNLENGPKSSRFPGFSTATGSKVEVSEDALKRAKTFFDDENSKNGCNNITNFPGFSTASGSHGEVLKKTFKDAPTISGSEMSESDKIKSYQKSPDFLGFSTASGSEVNISEDALRHARTFFDDDHSKNQEVPNLADFSSASGPRVNVSTAALKRGKTIVIEEMHEKCPSSAYEGCDNYPKLSATSEPEGVSVERRTTLPVQRKSMQKFKVPLKTSCEEHFNDRNWLTGRGKKLIALQSTVLPEENRTHPVSSGHVSSLKISHKGYDSTSDGQAFSSNASEKMFGKVPTSYIPPPSTVPSTEANGTDGKNYARVSKCPLFLPQGNGSKRVTRNSLKCLKMQVDSNSSKSLSRDQNRGSDERISSNSLTNNEVQTAIHSDMNFVLPAEDERRDQTFYLPKIDEQDDNGEESISRFNSSCGETELNNEEENQYLCETIMDQENYGHHLEPRGTTPIPENSIQTDANGGAEVFHLMEAGMKQEKITRMKKKGRVTPLPGRWWKNRVATGRVTPLQDVVGNTKGFSQSEVLLSLGVSESTLNISSKSSGEFRFNLWRFFPSLSSSVLLGDSAFLIPDRHGFAGTSEFYRAFLTLDGVDPALVDESWLQNHYRWIVWKLATYEVCYPSVFANRCLTPDVTMLQLKYRYDREIDNCQRSAIRKIVERDDAACKRMVLCVADIRKDAHQQNTLELTDGWYSIPAQLDVALQDLVERKKLYVGQKLLMSGVELNGIQDGCPPLELPSNAHLKLNFNSTRPAKAHAKLGFCSIPLPLCIPLASLHPEGGTVGCVDVVVTRKYPLLYMEKYPDRSCVFRTVDEENAARQKAEEHQQTRVEKLFSQIQQEMENQEEQGRKQNHCKWMKKEVEQLSTGSELAEAFDCAMNPEEFEQYLNSAQVNALMDFKRRQVETRQEELNKRVREAIASKTSTERNVTTVQKFRVKGCCPTDVDGTSGCLLTVWRPDAEWQEICEGKRYRFLNLSVSASRHNSQNGCKASLTANRQTRLQPKEIHESLLDLVYEPRQVLNISEIRERCKMGRIMELDFLGVALKVSVAKQPAHPHVIHAADPQGEILCIKIWPSAPISMPLIKETDCFVATGLSVRGHSGTGNPSVLLTADGRPEFSTLSTSCHASNYGKLLRNLQQLCKNTTFLSTARSCLESCLEKHRTPVPFQRTFSEAYQEDFSPEILEKMFCPMSSQDVSDSTSATSTARRQGAVTDAKQHQTLTECSTSDFLPSSSMFRGPLNVTNHQRGQSESNLKRKAACSMEDGVIKKKKKDLQDRIGRLLSYGRPSPLSPLPTNAVSSACDKNFKSPKSSHS